MQLVDRPLRIYEHPQHWSYILLTMATLMYLGNITQTLWYIIDIID